MTMLEAAHLPGTRICGGWLFFALLRWNTSLYCAAAVGFAAMAIQGSRFAAVGGLFALIALHGALPLLVTALGLLIARPIVQRCLIGGDA